MANKWSRSPEHTRESKRAKLSEGDDDDCLTCTICFLPCGSKNEHRLVALGCGHLFGDSCIRKWIAQCPTRLKRCPECRRNTAIADIRIIHANKIVVMDTDDDIVIRKELVELKRKMRNLKAMGIQYSECPICDMPFTSDLRRDIHKLEMHSA